MKKEYMSKEERNEKIRAIVSIICIIAAVISVTLLCVSKFGNAGKKANIRTNGNHLVAEKKYEDAIAEYEKLDAEEDSDIKSRIVYACMEYSKEYMDENNVPEKIDSDKVDFLMKVLENHPDERLERVSVYLNEKSADATDSLAKGQTENVTDDTAESDLQETAESDLQETTGEEYNPDPLNLGQLDIEGLSWNDVCSNSANYLADYGIEKLGSSCKTKDYSNITEYYTDMSGDDYWYVDVYNGDKEGDVTWAHVIAVGKGRNYQINGGKRRLEYSVVGEEKYDYMTYSIDKMKTLLDDNNVPYGEGTSTSNGEIVGATLNFSFITNGGIQTNVIFWYSKDGIIEYITFDEGEMVADATESATFAYFKDGSCEMLS